MTSLDRNLRRDLENAVKKARRVAEAGARDAINQLAVAHHEPWPTLSPEQRRLRNRLRAHGRQLGDRLDERKGTQTIERLTSECAYEHLHRLLFARFLAENELLVEPESGMALSLDECRELARDRGMDWLMLASDFAQRMLPQVFRVGDPVLDVLLPPEKRRELEGILEPLPREVFVASDSLGWVYQFWQAERKEAVNAAGNKIGADELPSVTQLFTEDYMVDFLLDNTLGAWHAGKVLAANPKLAQSAHSEDELRRAVALSGCPWRYLRFFKGKDGKWTPAAGTFEAWPKSAAALKALDPCMGSGHFVVAMFERLVALRMVEEKVNEATAVAAVIRDNLFGLEIDPRCTQIAAFNLALTAWRRVGHCQLPAMNLACSGLSPNTREADWLVIAGDDQKLQRGMGRLYRLFQKAALLGSLINPRSGEDDLLEATFHELQPLLEKALAQENQDDIAHEMAVTARGLAKAAEILAGQFTLVATNVPFLGRGKQDGVLQEYCERMYPAAKPDLATCFVQRSQEFCSPGGTTSLVMPQNWLFLFTYRALRRGFIDGATVRLVAELGAGAFQTPLYDFSFALFITTNLPGPADYHYSSLVASASRSIEAKIDVLANAACTDICVTSVRSQDDWRFLTQAPGEHITRLSATAVANTGLQSNDNDRFCRCFWEFPRLFVGWEFFQRTSEQTMHYGGRELVLLWEGGKGRLRELTASQDRDRRTDMRGVNAWGKGGVLVHRMGNLPATLFTGELFDQNGAAIVPLAHEHLPALWCFLSSDGYKTEVRKLDNKVGVTPATLTKVPFDLTHWQKAAAEKYPRGLPKPFSSDPTQWLFNGQPAGADHPLQVAVSRLLDYKWPRQTGSNFPDCAALGQDGLEELEDGDGIVSLSAIRGEDAAVERLRRLLGVSFGSDWSADKLDKLVSKGSTASKTLELWLRQDFFAQHCALFQQRPFIWQVWDGLDRGFSALVNYHKLAAPNGAGRRTLEKLTHTYLGDWLERQRADQKAGVEGADGRVAAAEHLRRELENILKGEPPYDIFVRWKPLHEQPIGWEPDIHDGVRVNIRPFMTAKPLNARGKNACILRVAAKIQWDKDRGKEPTREKADFPWFWGWDGETRDFAGGKVFDGNRWNDLHYSRAVKLAARERAKGGRS